MPPSILASLTAAMQSQARLGYALPSMTSKTNKRQRETSGFWVDLTVAGNGLALQYASDDDQNNYDIVIQAVENNGLALQFASPEMQKNRNIVKAAVTIMIVRSMIVLRIPRCFKF